jgi:uncharacterized membrane protein
VASLLLIGFFKFIIDLLFKFKFNDGGDISFNLIFFIFYDKSTILDEFNNGISFSVNVEPLVTKPFSLTLILVYVPY